MATTMAPAAVVASATTPTLPSSPCGTSNDEFLKSLAALRQLLSVNYDALDDDIHSLRISKSILTTASSASLRLQQQQQSQQPEPPQSPPQQEVADEQSELESLRHHLEAANKDLEKERAERKQLEESHAQLVEENQGRSKQKEDLSTLKSLQEDLDIVRSRWKEEKDKAQRDQQKLKQALEQVAAERSQALQTVDVCQTKILSLQKQVRELQTQKDSQRDNWDLERNTLEETIHSWESAHRTLQRRLEEQAKVNEEVKDKLEVMQREYLQMQAMNAEYQQTARQSLEDVANMRDELAYAQSQANGWRRTLDQTDRVLQENNREIVELQQKLEEERSEHEQTKSRMQQLGNTNDSKRRHEQGQQDQQIQQLEQKIASLTQQLKDRVQKKLFDQKQHIELISQVKAKEDQLQAKDKEMQQLKQKHEALSKLEISNRARIEALRKSVATFKNQPDTQKLQDELTQTKAYLHNAQTEIQQALAQLSTVVVSKESKGTAGKVSLSDLIAQLVADKEQLNQGPSPKRLTPARRTPSPCTPRQASPRNLVLLAQEAAKSLHRKGRSPSPSPRS